MIANYHAHTFRCSHATGTEREYVERALENGIRVMGFSDHFPWRFPDGYESGYRVPCASAQEYIQTVRSLAEEYAGRIELHAGFEMEYYPLYFKDMIRYAVELDADYLILGQHFLYNEQPSNYHSTQLTDSIEHMDEYVRCVAAAIRSGQISCVAHPDMFNYSGSDETFCEHMRPICEAAGECGVPLEINFLGIRGHRNYPRECFWKLAGECGVPVIYGFDAHDTPNAYDGESLKVAEQWREKYHLNVQEKLVLRKPHIITE